MQHFSENYWKKRLAKTVFTREKGKWPENGRNGEKGKRNRMPGKGRRQSPRSEIGAQAVLDDEEAERRRLEALLGVTDEKSRKVAESGRL